MKVMCINTKAIPYENEKGTSHVMDSHCQTIRIWERAIQNHNYLATSQKLLLNIKKLGFNYIKTARISSGYLNQYLNL